MRGTRDEEQHHRHYGIVTVNALQSRRSRGIRVRLFFFAYLYTTPKIYLARIRIPLLFQTARIYTRTVNLESGNSKLVG